VDTLQLLLLERPLAVLVALGFVEGICLVLLYAHRTRRVLIAAAVPIVLGGIVVIVSAVVTTQRERVNAALVSLCRATAAGDMEDVSQGVDGAYDDGVYRKAELLAIVDRTRSRLGLRDVKLFDVRTEIDGGRAVIDCRAVLHVRDNPTGRNVVMTRWRLWWTLRSDRWRLASSRLVEPQNLPRAPSGPR